MFAPRWDLNYSNDIIPPSLSPSSGICGSTRLLGKKKKKQRWWCHFGRSVSSGSSLVTPSSDTKKVYIQAISLCTTPQLHQPHTSSRISNKQTTPPTYPPWYPSLTELSNSPTLSSSPSPFSPPSSPWPSQLPWWRTTMQRGTHPFTRVRTGTESESSSWQVYGPPPSAVSTTTCYTELLY